MPNHVVIRPKIAAMDIADVAQADDDLFADSDEGEDDYDDESSRLDGDSVDLSSQYSGRTGDTGNELRRGRKEDALVREVRMDAGKKDQAVTYVINADGSFEHK